MNDLNWTVQNTIAIILEINVYICIRDKNVKQFNFLNYELFLLTQNLSAKQMKTILT